MCPALSLQGDPDCQCARRGHSRALCLLRNLRQGLPRPCEENPVRSEPSAFPAGKRGDSLCFDCPQLCGILQRRFDQPSCGGFEETRFCGSFGNGSRRGTRKRRNRENRSGERSETFYLKRLSGVRGLYPEICAGIYRLHRPCRIARDGACETSETDLRR